MLLPDGHGIINDHGIYPPGIKHDHLGIHLYMELLPSGKHTKNYGKSQFLMGKSTISMGHFP